MIKTNELLDVVKQVMSGVKTSAADARNAMFRDGEVFTWSPALSVSAKLPPECADLDGVVRVTDLCSVLSKIRRDEIDISCERGKWVVTAGDAAVEMVTRADEQLRERMEGAASFASMEWAPLPGNFYECLAVCSIPNNRCPLAGTLITSGGTVYATDCVRYHQARLDGGFAPGGDVWISVFSTEELLANPIRFSEFAVGGKWVYFRSKESALVFACARLDETSYRTGELERIFQMFDSESGVSGVFPDMGDALGMAQIFDDSSFKPSQGGQMAVANVISLRFERKRLVVSSERSATGSFRQVLAYPDGGELDVDGAIQVKLTGPFLREALKSTRRFSVISKSGATVVSMQGGFFRSLLLTVA